MSGQFIWLYVRIVLLALVAILAGAAALGTNGAQVNPASTHENAWVAIGLYLVLTPVVILVAVPFVLYVQLKNPFGSRRWQRPSWFVNPLNMSEPLVMFDYFGYGMMAGGLGWLAVLPWVGARAWPEGALYLSVGIGVSCGVKMCMVIYRSRFHDINDAN